MFRGLHFFFVSSVVVLSLLVSPEALARRRSICGGGGCGIQSVSSCGQRGGCQVQPNNNNNDNQELDNLDAINQFQAIIGAGNFGQFGNNGQFGQFGNNGQFGQFGNNGQFGGISNGSDGAPGLADPSGFSSNLGGAGGGFNLGQISFGNTPGITSLSQVIPLSSNTVGVNGQRRPPGAAAYRFVNDRLFWLDSNGNLLNNNGSISQIGNPNGQLGGQGGGQGGGLIGGGPGGVVNPAVGGPQNPQPQQPLPRPVSPQPGVGDTSGGGGHDIGVVPTQPGRPTDAAKPTKFSNWKKIFTDAGETFDKEKIDGQIEARLVDESDGWKLAMFPQKCANSAKKDDVKDATLIMASKKNSSGVSETYFMLKKGGVPLPRNIEAMKVELKKLREETVAIGKAKNPTDPETANSLIQAFAYSGTEPKDYSEVQHRVRPVMKEGKITSFTTAQLLRHKDDVPKDKPAQRWGTSNRDIEMYCKPNDDGVAGDQPTPRTPSTPAAPTNSVLVSALKKCASCHTADGDAGDTKFIVDQTSGAVTLKDGFTKQQVNASLNRMKTRAGISEAERAAIEAWASGS